MRLLLKVKVYEVSVVSVGANPASAVTGVKSAKGVFADAAESAEHRGLMVGFFLSDDAAGKLAVEGGEPAEQLHLTLCYCGDVRALDDMTVAQAMVAVRDVASWHAPLVGKVNGWGRFNASNTSDGKDVIYAGVDMPGLVELFDWVSYALNCAGVPPRREHGFFPHVTLAYAEPGSASPVEAVESLPLRFDALVIVIGGESTVVPLGGRGHGMCSPYMFLGDENAETKSQAFITGESGAPAALKFADHSETVLAAVQGYATRAKSIHELRAKEGRTLSASNRERMSGAMGRIGDCITAMQAVHDDMGELLAAAEPQPKSADPARVRSLKSRFLLFEATLHGVAVSGEN